VDLPPSRSTLEILANDTIARAFMKHPAPRDATLAADAWGAPLHPIHLR
jgi:hypothetical protein